MLSSTTILFARRITLVKALALLGQTAEIQRSLDAEPLPEPLMDAEERCEASAYAEYGYLSAAQKTEHFCRALQRVMRAKEFAAHFEPVSRRYAPGDLIEKLTAMRQWADRHGIPYDFFAIEASRFRIDRNNLVDPETFVDTPELEDFTRANVFEYVLERWEDPSCRLQQPFEPRRWDVRFRSKRRRAESQHRALYALIQRRVEDAQAAGQDSACELRAVVPVFMNEKEAVERFGKELVARAMATRDPRDE